MNQKTFILFVFAFLCGTDSWAQRQNYIQQIENCWDANDTAICTAKVLSRQIARSHGGGGGTNPSFQPGLRRKESGSIDCPFAKFETLTDFQGRVLRIDFSCDGGDVFNGRYERQSSGVYTKGELRLELFQETILLSSPTETHQFSNEEILEEGATLLGENSILWVVYDESVGSVCDDNFDEVDGRVACQSMGMNYRNHWSVTGTTDEFLLDDLNCEGDESSLLDCPHAGLRNENCSSGETVALSCQ